MKKTLLIYAIMALGCAEKELVVPIDILGHDKMVAILTDAQIIEAAIQRRLFSKDSLSGIAKWHYDAVFKEQSVTEEEFKRSYDYYKDYPEEFERIWEDVFNELSKKQAEVKKEILRSKKQQRYPLQKEKSE